MMGQAREEEEEREREKEISNAWQMADVSGEGERWFERRART